MAKLIYSVLASLDGYIEDEAGRIDWAAPDEEVHGFVNELERGPGTYLYGRRMYETMVYWETAGAGPGDSGVSREYADIWRAAEKVVYSRSLQAATSTRTRIEREFDPEAVRHLKHESSRDITVGGPELAAVAFHQELVDECHLFLVPVVLGAGKPALPRGLRIRLGLLGEHRFAGGVVHLHYRVER